MLTPACMFPKRTEELCKYLFQYKAASSAQIARDLFPKREASTVRRTLIKLTRKKIIRRIPSTLKHKIYSLGAEGFRNFIGHDGSTRREMLTSKLAHDLMLVDIGQKIAKLPNVKKYLPENILKCEAETLDPTFIEKLGGTTPDSVAIIPHKGEELILAIEYEASAKVYERYKDIFQKYYLAPQIAGVLYICEKEGQTKSLAAIDRKIRPCKHSKFFFTTLEIFFSDPLPRFVSPEKAIFTLGK